MTEKKDEAQEVEKKPASKASSKAREGAPKTETPEKPKVPPKETPRDEESDLETPENPSYKTVPVTITLDSKKLSEAVVRHVLAKTTRAEFVAELQQAAATGEVDLHIASHPVDAHAPLWLGREPNSP